jgi:hypothetical protein
MEQIKIKDGMQVRIVSLSDAYSKPEHNELLGKTGRVMHNDGSGVGNHDWAVSVNGVAHCMFFNAENLEPYQPPVAEVETVPAQPVSKESLRTVSELQDNEAKAIAKIEGWSYDNENDNAHFDLAGLIDYITETPCAINKSLSYLSKIGIQLPTKEEILQGETVEQALARTTVDFGRIKIYNKTPLDAFRNGFEAGATWKESQLSTIIASKDAEIERLKHLSSLKAG